MVNKLFFKKWTIGICVNATIGDILSSGKFDPEIKWMRTKSTDEFFADPFPLYINDNNIKILCESLAFDKDYGKISLLTLDRNANQVSRKTLLDTKSHLSYPFVFRENGNTYIFPESGKSGKLSCYQFDPVTESINFVQDIISEPLLDATIIKLNGKYWVFACTWQQGEKNYELKIFYSSHLLGPYTVHAGNPIKTGLDGIRSAGNIFEMDGILYRPAQNCKKLYGESIVINKITELSENTFAETPSADICINKKRKSNFGIHTLHTINVVDDAIIVDGEYWFFAPIQQLKKSLKYRAKKYVRQK